MRTLSCLVGWCGMVKLSTALSNDSDMSAMMVA